MDVIEGPPFEWKADRLSSSQMEIRSPLILRMEIRNQVFEKIIGFNNLRSICVLEQLLKLSRAVAHITLPGRGLATGFMITPDVLMTNNHVFESKDDAKDAIIRFNYQIDLSGKFLATDDYECDPSFFHTNKSLDYSIVKIKGSPGIESKWGHFELPLQPDLRLKEDVFIIQHPKGEHKQIAMTENEIAYFDDTLVQYLTDTMPGSSGSPVINEAMRLVALHHSGGDLLEPSTGSVQFRNEGIRISAILNDLPKLD